MLLKAGAVSLALLLLSRVMGLVRESAQAAAFGATGLGDVAVLMLSLPDWLTGLLASGALAYVLLPHWAGQGAAAQSTTQRRVARVLLGLGAGVGLLALALAAPLAGLLLPGLPASLQALAVPGLRWSALALPAALLAALWVTRLQHERDFTGLYAANLVVNAVVCAALAWLAVQGRAGQDGPLAIAVLGLALLAAMGLRLLWLGWRLRRVAQPAGDDPSARPSAAPGDLPRSSLWVWATLSAGLPLALPFVARSLASGGGEGQLATFNYAWKLVELPLVLAIQLVASLAFPAIARARVTNDSGDAVRGAFVLAWTLACAATGALALAAPAIAQLLFGWGRMAPEALADVAAWGAAGAWTLPPQALVAVALTVLASEGRMRPAVAAYGLALGGLLLAGLLGLHGGAALMGLLVGLFVGVAALCLWALGPQAGGWLPWRGLLGPLAAALAAWAAARLGLAQAWVGQPLPALLAAALFALFVLALGALASPELRRMLRR